MATSIIPLVSQPGVKRDGTTFEGGAHVDARWCRWQRGLPRKIGGFRSLVDWNGPKRALHVAARNGVTIFHGGWSDGIEAVAIDSNGAVAGGITNRTPVGFAAGANNDWQIQAMRNAAGSNQAILAWAGPTLDDIAKESARPVYLGDITATAAPLTAIAGSAVDGGIVVLAPYFVRFGTGGFVGWSNINQPTQLATGDANEAYVTDAKIVAGLPYRGGTANSPAGLLWSLNALLRMSFTGGSTVFRFDTVSTQTSILSANSVIEYDGLFYWAGVDRFLVFNGVVSEVPNPFNSNWFFDNLNYAARQKVFAYKVPRFGEIWWCYPRGTATECTHAVIYNVREKVWYDTELPNGTRTAGAFSQVFRYPVMNATVGSTSSLYQHEFGTDAVLSGGTQALESFYELADISTLIPQGGQKSDNHQVRVEAVEPDFVQTGGMTVQIKGRANARAPEVDGPIKPFDPDTQFVYVKEQRRELRVRFTSNATGGHYEAGEPLAHVGVGDGTRRG
jgi:hypothetical protein